MKVERSMSAETVIEIIAQGAWNGGTLVDNTHYENQGMSFKGGIPVTPESIEERIGVRTRMAAPADERIGVSAFRDLLETSGIDPARIKVLIAATNVGEDKQDPGPLSRHPFELVRRHCPEALVMDLYAGCPGFNVAVEALFMLSLSGRLRAGDLSVIVGAENIHRARAFKPMDTANIIFGDDALATALETGGLAGSSAPGRIVAEAVVPWQTDFIGAIAAALLPWAQSGRIDGILIDNQMGRIELRVPATAARVQQALMERLYPQECAAGAFQNFRAAMEIYARRGNGFAYDVMSADAAPGNIQRLAQAYTASGAYHRLAACYLAPGEPIALSLIEGSAGGRPKARRGVLDTRTCTHGCFGSFIEAWFDSGEAWGAMDGKGVFLYATRGAKAHLETLLAANALELENIELLIEHQANFAMLPLTLEQLLADKRPAEPGAVARFLADKMVTNIHRRGNCSVVCMQRLPYDLARGALSADTVQGYAINRNLDRLKDARLILYDSVGAGMTRSSFLRRAGG
jgi:3-oxoacyl-[acyl-carrier-protein] synthase III